MKALIQIVLLVYGIIYTRRRFKIKAVQNEKYPSASLEEFSSWQSMALKNNRMFLWGTWGLFVMLTPIAYNFIASLPLYGGLLTEGIFSVSCVVLTILIIKSVLDERKNAKLGNDLGIVLSKK